MHKETFKFTASSTDYYSSFNFADLKKIAARESAVIITDQNIFDAHKKKFKGWNTIVLAPGEEYKIQGTVDTLIEQLLAFETDRTSTLVGVGGGVITDITGYVASIYMRGIRFGFIPTSILGLVDASIGGKNGIDFGSYKNMVGVIRQPNFIAHDFNFLTTLPLKQWQNGFAEIIKHASIKDASMFNRLEKNSIQFYRKDQKALAELIRRNFLLKTKLVQRDEFEKSERRLLNFGHTLGHALEMQYDLLHGEAISIGMIAACSISEQLTAFSQTERLSALLEKYGLPTHAKYDVDKIFEVLKMDKKRVRTVMNYVLLEKIGRAVIKPIPLKQVQRLMHTLL